MSLHPAYDLDFIEYSIKQTNKFTRLSNKQTNQFASQNVLKTFIATQPTQDTELYKSLFFLSYSLFTKLSTR